MADLVRWLVDAIHLFTPRGYSPSNGRIERVHRYLNEYLRTHHTGKGMSYTTFCDLIQHAVYSWDVTKRRGVSPLSFVYTFPASMDIHVPRQCRRGFSYVESCVVDPPPDETISAGTRVLVRCPTQVPKLDLRWYTAIVIRQLSPSVFITKADVTGHETSTHSRDIKLFQTDDPLPDTFAHARSDYHGCKRDRSSLPRKGKRSLAE
ncbi:hypothetical protein Pmar_PMAR016171 [Perkinsus marinus ATCC 50983]|uniref:Integrase catalytic domain-containing protein n=2 Tax=Perkinsus marinus (strain ATCC 50983 / TXsc) TaxID=423536 RepID=C5LVL4_PERM5|nr:hypothetical protein Pmar_PMAR016171 [Perkinsus marinus ATCC 50983]EEQ99229.1 hypothetical protein Pmar_PMAR016171 [Perkinsus marinus ATCC 50983]|eukprot:XP_002766512.1 hypothetical protein Pmar_PMAR016171 [Perkinsus marinus ATCC 50983]